MRGMEKRTIMYLLITLETKRHSLKLSGSELKGNGRTMQNQTGWKGAQSSDIQHPRELFPTARYTGQPKIVRKIFIYCNIIWLGEGLKGHLVQALLKEGPNVMLSYIFM